MFSNIRSRTEWARERHTVGESEEKDWGREGNRDLLQTWQHVLHLSRLIKAADPLFTSQTWAFTQTSLNTEDVNAVGCVCGPKSDWSYAKGAKNHTQSKSICCRVTVLLTNNKLHKYHTTNLALLCQRQMAQKKKSFIADFQIPLMARK